MIIGVDIGYSYTKDSNEKIFKSAMATDDYGVTGGVKADMAYNFC